GAITDIEKARARALAPSAQTPIFDNYEQMLTSDSVDAVIASTPPQFHEEVTIAALEAGKHVLCEKPLSNSVEGCRRMLDAARRTGKTLATGFNQRYFPAIQFVKRTLDSGLIGELDHIRAFAGHTGLSEFKAPWMYDKKVMGGGALMDIGIHIIDLTAYLLGGVEEVFGIASGDVWKLDRVEDNGLALLLSPQKKRAILQATWTEWKGYRFHIKAYGQKGMVRAYYAPMMNMVIYLDKPGGRRRRKFNFYPMNIVEEKRHGWQSTVVKTFQQELTDFVKLCEGKPGIIADGFSGFRAVEIVDAIYRSTEEKQMIRLTSPF
ncbi:MAG: Gfo/Idh/MocA family oxidoreductase, partial [Acidobacteria bacterium]|nr:Gfo/Idh/MocA family oxidoreductase [Acidobacteriota bacterium]